LLRYGGRMRAVAVGLLGIALFIGCAALNASPDQRVIAGIVGGRSHRLWSLVRRRGVRIPRPRDGDTSDRSIALARSAGGAVGGDRRVHFLGDEPVSRAARAGLRQGPALGVPRRRGPGGRAARTAL